MAKSFSVTVFPDPLGGEYLTVSDALNQVLDMIDALEQAESSKPSERKIVWRLTKAHTNSPPFTLVAEPFPIQPELSVLLEASRVLDSLSFDFKALLEGDLTGVVYDALPTIKKILSRNSSTISRTEVLIDDKSAFSIRQQNARIASFAIDRYEIDQRSNTPDWRRTEYGTVEGEIAGLTKWSNKPALIVVERLSEKRFTCILSDELSQRLGPQHSWAEVWEGRRVHLTGALHYQADGDLLRADIEDLIEVPWTDVRLVDLRSIDILQGKTVLEHLELVRGEGIG